MQSNEQRIVDEVVQRLLEVFPIEKIILFGSRARGDTHEDSDFDFLVIMDTDEKPIRRGFPVRQVGRIPGVPMDFLVRTPAEWERGFPLKKEIVAEGSILFEKPNGTVVGEGA